MQNFHMLLYFQKKNGVTIKNQNYIRFKQKIRQCKCNITTTCTRCEITQTKARKLSITLKKITKTTNGKNIQKTHVELTFQKNNIKLKTKTVCDLNIFIHDRIKFSTTKKLAKSPPPHTISFKYFKQTRKANTLIASKYIMIRPKTTHIISYSQSLKKKRANIMFRCSAL